MADKTLGFDHLRGATGEVLRNGISVVVEALTEKADLAKWSKLKYVNEVVELAKKLPPGTAVAFGAVLSALVATSSFKNKYPLYAMVLAGVLEGGGEGIDRLFKAADDGNTKVASEMLRATMTSALAAKEEKMELWATGNDPESQIHSLSKQNLCRSEAKHLQIFGTPEEIQAAHGHKNPCPKCFPDAKTLGKITLEEVIKEAPEEVKSLFSSCPPEKAEHLTGIIAYALEYQLRDAPDAIAPREATDVSQFEVVVDQRPGAVATFLRLIFGGTLPTRTVHPLTEEIRDQITAEMAVHPTVREMIGQFLFGGPNTRRIHPRRRPTAPRPLNPFDRGDGFAFRAMGALRKAAKTDPKGLIDHLKEGVTADDVLREPAKHAGPVLALALGDYDAPWGEWVADTIDGWVSFPTLKRQVADFTSGRDVTSLLGSVARILAGFLILVIGPILAAIVAFDGLAALILCTGTIVFLVNTLGTVYRLINEGAHYTELGTNFVIAAIAAGTIFVGRSMLPLNDDVLAWLNGLLNPLNSNQIGGKIGKKIADGLRTANILQALTNEEVAAAVAESGALAKAKKRVGRFTWYGLLASHVSLIPTAVLFIAALAHPFGQGLTAVLSLVAFALIALLAEVMKLASATVDNVKTADSEQTYAEMARKTIREGLPNAILGDIALIVVIVVLSWPTAWLFGKPIGYGEYARVRYEDTQAFYSANKKSMNESQQVTYQQKVEEYHDAYLSAGSRGLVPSSAPTRKPLIAPVAPAATGAVKTNKSTGGKKPWCREGSTLPSCQ